MRAATKTGFAVLLLAIVLSSPIGDCAEWMMAASQPASHCSPAKSIPDSDDCSAPGCVFLDTHKVPSADAPSDVSGPLSDAALISAAVEHQLAFAEAGPAPPNRFAPRPRFVVFHQFII